MAKIKKLNRKEKILQLPISKFIDTKFRDYAVYVLSSRGIPSFTDCLTPVQRYILKNAPQTFQKTLTVVGKCIQAGYHHGNCIDGSTMINLDDGSQISIGDWFKLKPEDHLIVKCVDDEGNKTTSVGHSPRVGQVTNEYYEIELETGEVIKCTANHPFLVNGKWVMAKDLNDTDELTTIS